MRHMRFDPGRKPHGPFFVEYRTMKTRQNFSLILFICAFTSSAFAALFDPPAPLIRGTDRNLTNEEIFNAFHSFMPDFMPGNGLRSRQSTRPAAVAQCGHIPAGVSDHRRDKQ